MENHYNFYFRVKFKIFLPNARKSNLVSNEIYFLSGSVRGRFPDLKMKPDELDDMIYKTGKKLKDAYRKKKPKTI